MERILNINWESRIKSNNKRKKNAREIIDSVLRELEEDICVKALIKLSKKRKIN